MGTHARGASGLGQIEAPGDAVTGHRLLVVRRSSRRRNPKDMDLLRALSVLGHTVFDLDVSRHPDTVREDASNEHSSPGFAREPVCAVFERFAPQAVLFCGEDLLPRDSTAAWLRDHGMPTLAVLDRQGATPGTDHLLVRPTDPADLGPALYRALETVRQAAGLITGPRPRTVILSGYYGAQNRGDELLLEALTSHLEAAVPDLLPVVAASDPGEVERDHGIQSFRRSDLTMAEFYAARAHAVVLGPGGHWHDYSIDRAGGAAGLARGARLSPSHMAQIPLLVSAYGGAVFVQGMGVGPLSDVAARAAVHLTGQLSTRVTVRDQGSADLLLPQSDAWPSSPQVTPDVVYALELPPVAQEIGSTGDLVVNLRPWSDAPESRRTLIEAIIDVACERGLRIVGLPMQPTDLPPLQELLDAAAQGPGLPVKMIPADAPFTEVLDLLDGSAGLVSMRLHANLMMHRRRRAALGLSYDPKVRAHFEQLHRDDCVVDLDAPDADVRSALARVLDHPELPETAQQALASLEAQSRQDLADLSALVARGPARRLDPAWIHHLPPTPPQPTHSETPAAQAWWPAEQVVDPSCAQLRAENVDDPQRRVPVLRSTDVTGDRFSLADRAPRRGDRVTWTLAVPAVAGEGLRVELSLRQRYEEEKVKYSGRLVYTVLVDGEELMVHDVATWNERQTVWIATRASGPLVQVEIRLEALRDGDDWGWGPPTALTVERIRSLPWDGRDQLVWGCSSPYALAAQPQQPDTDSHGNPAPSAAVQQAAARRPLWRRAAARVARRVTTLRSPRQR